MDVALDPGSVSETVNVVASAVTLTTENAAIGQVIDNKRVVDLPLNGRNMIQLAVMIPGVQFGSRSGVEWQSGFPIPGSGMSVIANGQREVHQSVTLDCVESITPLYNITSFTPSIDAIEEFRVQTGFAGPLRQTCRHLPARRGQSDGGLTDCGACAQKPPCGCRLSVPEPIRYLFDVRIA